MFKFMKKLSCKWHWLWLSLVVIALDLFTKFLAVRFLSYHSSVKVLPGFNFYLAHNNLANIYANQGNLIKSIEYFKRTLIINNKHHSARHNLGMIQLLCNDYKEGLVNFEFRHNKLKGNTLHAKPKIKRWYGERQDL